MKKHVVASLLAFAATGVLAQQHPHGMPPGLAKKMQGNAAPAPAPVCTDCGTVQAVKYEKRKGEGGAVGIVAGAVGGGFVGNEVQKRVTTKEVWITQVKMRDGSMRSFEQDHAPGWKAGTQVRVQGKGLVVFGS